MAAPRVARVLLDSPLPQLDHLFDYAIPEAFASEIVVGARVRIPLRSGGRVATGYVIELLAESSFGGTLAEIAELVSAAPVLSPEQYLLFRALADRSAGTASDLVRLGVPARQVRVEKAWLSSERDESVAAPVTTERTVLHAYPGLRDALHAGERLALTAPGAPVQLPDGTTVGAWALLLAEAAEEVRHGGRSALLAVPGQRDLAELCAAVAAVSPAGSWSRVDAGQSGPERYRAYLSGLERAPRIIVGNRSALLAPAHRLGLVALWDDGDSLHEEPHAPYLHARDVALVRQRQSGSALILAAHARSVDAQRLVEAQWLRALPAAAPVAPRVLVGRALGDDPTRTERIPGSAWRHADRALADGPVLFLVARPGYAPTLACGSCGQSAHCRECAGPLALVTGDRAPVCRWCGHPAHDWHCTECSSTTLRMITRGSGRTAEELGRAFPTHRVIVSDGESPRERVGPEPALVIATRGAEPIAAGGYRAVIILDAARMLQAESLRIGEECVRWWSNAAALAAPGAPVILPGVEGRAANAVAAWNQPAYAHQELLDRQELHFPPAVRLATVTGTDAALTRALAELPPLPPGAVLGPTPHEDGRRAIIRFPYAAGESVATALKAAVIREATAKRPPGARAGSRPRPTLRVRFDDPEILA